MPRHNYWKAAPLVKALCDKHGIEYKSKTPELRELQEAATNYYSSCHTKHELPHNKEKATPSSPAHSSAENLKSLRIALYFLSLSKQCQRPHRFEMED